IEFSTEGLNVTLVQAPAPSDYKAKDDAIEHYGLGNQLAHSRKFEDAILEYKQASRLDPGYPHPHRALGVVYAALGKRELSQTSYQTYLRLAPHAADKPQVLKIVKASDSE
ncbi:MAG: tetratricopeptide repeat protein, partial [Deltaproteobacteria bacterium]|nr:tetratricopeptide repeat protein [Deltaproteobacteria bacterium]